MAVNSLFAKITLLKNLPIVRESFCESGFPEKGADLREFGELPGKFGKLPGSSGLLLSSIVRELPGKSLKNFRGSSGNFWGSSGLPRSSGEPDSLPATRQICLQNWTHLKGPLNRGASNGGLPDQHPCHQVLHSFSPSYRPPHHTSTECTKIALFSAVAAAIFTLFFLAEKGSVSPNP